MVGGGWGLHSYFHVQPNYSVAVVLCCVFIGVRVVTTLNIVCFPAAGFSLLYSMMHIGNILKSVSKNFKG